MNCQVFTPSDYVEILLNQVNYKCNLYKKKILENSCGDGNILSIVVKRYIEDCINNGIPKHLIKSGLENDIRGYEIDLKQYNKCIEKLNNILSEYKIEPINWCIYNEDYLYSETNEKYDFIVGNPPYINYRDIELKDRNNLRMKFDSCKKGKFDYCYAFIEKSINSLSDEGKMSYLIPSSIFKTVFGIQLRNLMKYHIIKIIDYSSVKVFSEVLVSSAIMVLNKNKNNDIFEYIDVKHNDSIILSNLELKEKWVFDSDNNIGNRKFGEFFHVTNAVATLFNDAFIINEWKYNKPYYEVNNQKIEDQLIYDSASPKMLAYGKKYKIIFPYYYLDGKLCHYTADEFETKFPYAVKYLNQFRQKLDNRKKDKSALWFEYGRSQALTKLKRKKLLMSTIITDSVKLYILDENNIPYSGLFIYPTTNKLSLEDAVRILNSDAFYNYVLRIGIHMNGNSYRVTSRDILNYRF